MMFFSFDTSDRDLGAPRGDVTTRHKLDASSARPRRILLYSSVVVVCALLQTCASIYSDKKGDGLIYYLPKRDVQVTVVIPPGEASSDTSPGERLDEGSKLEGTAVNGAEGGEEAQVKTVTISVKETDAYPDVRKAYVASIPRNVLGGTDGTISVNTAGLLNTESKSSTTSQVGQILQNVAGAIGAGARVNTRATPMAQAPMCTPGTYTKILTIPDQLDAELCGVEFKVEPMIKDATQAPGVTPADANTNGTPSTLARAGLFYRQMIPYKVTATSKQNASEMHQFMVLSPSGSNTYFLPIEVTAFGANTASLTFDNGVPTKYAQKIDSGLVAITAIPAQVIGAYVKAVTDGFKNQKDILDAQAAYLKAQSDADIARARRDACIAALPTNNLDIIKVACSQ